MNHHTASASDPSAPCLRAALTCAAVEHNGELAPALLGPLYTGTVVPFWLRHESACYAPHAFLENLVGRCELYTTRTWAMARLADLYLNCAAAPRYVAPVRRRKALAAA